MTMGGISEEMRDKVFDMILQTKEEPLTAGAELEFLNQIKEDLFAALTAFVPHLPAQYGTQVSSVVVKMQDNVDMIREREELL